MHGLTPFAHMHFRYYASTMGRFMKPDNMITNAANPQSWNLYSYVNVNPVNFNDPGGHYCKAGNTSQVLFSQYGAMGLSDAYGGMWENPQEKGTMAGFAGGYGGGAEASGTETVIGSWQYVPSWGELVATGNGSFTNTGMNGDVATDLQISGSEWVIHDATWVLVPYMAGGGGGRSPASGGRGYHDINLTGGAALWGVIPAGITLGFMIHDNSVHPYIGLANVYPFGLGFSVTYSEQSITEGINVGWQTTVGLSFQYGLTKEGNFLESGGGLLYGAAFSVYYVGPELPKQSPINSTNRKYYSVW